jgi:hypothetical protein
MINVVEISKSVLSRMSKMDYESVGGDSSERLIFPKKVNGSKAENRISEQELRLIFIEELRNKNPNSFYSVETPTGEKYVFGKKYTDIKATGSGRSASLDLCIFKRKNEKYNRSLNIEFKHSNIPIKNIAKDILKLIHEEQDGAFIHLLDNTDRGTLCNTRLTGVWDKLFQSFKDFKKYWSNDKKSIQIVIMSLKENTLIYRKIKKADLKNLDSIFFRKDICGAIDSVSSHGWKKYEV